MTRKSNLDTSEVMFLRGIKKTAVILLLLIRMDRPLTAREAAHILDISYTTICIYFRHLSSANFVTKTRSGYILTQFGSQLLLPMDAPSNPERLKNMEIPYFPINSNTITTTINSSYKKDEDLIVVNNSNNEKNAEIWHIFSRYGIGRNARTRRLAGQPYMTPEYIERHAEHLREAGKTFPQWSGLLIRIMERGEPPPHPMFCSCKECLVRLSELGIEH